MRFRFCAFVAGSSKKFDEKSFEYRRKRSPNRRKIDAKLILGGFWRSKPFRERAGTRLGRVRDAQKRPRDRSSGVRGGPRAFGDRPKASPGGSQDAPGRLRSHPRAHLVHRALSSTLAERFRIVFVVSRKSSKLKIRAPTQCFVSLGQCTHRPCASVEPPRKSSRFGLQNRARERPGDPKSSAGGPDRAKMRARGAPGASENLKVSASGRLRARKRVPVPPRSERSPEASEGFFRNLRMD